LDKFPAGFFVAFIPFFCEYRVVTLKKRRTILFLCFLTFLACMPPLVLYSLGYRWDWSWENGFQAYKTGALYISSPVTGSKILVNKKEEKQTNIFQSGLFLQSLKPGKYAVSVTMDGYWSWSKNFIVKEEMVTETRAMLIPIEPQGKIVFWENYTPLEITKYYEILTSLKNLKNTAHSKMTANQKEKLSWDPKTNKVFAEWLGDKESLPYFFCNDKICSEKIAIFQAPANIKNIDFYPGRADAAIIAFQNAVYAVEFDGRGGDRNIEPVYKGKNPNFATYKNDGSVYILEENKLIEIKL